MLARIAESRADACLRMGLLSGVYWDTKKSLTRLARNYLEAGERIDHLLVGYRSMVMPRWLLVVTDRAMVVIEVDINPRSGLTRPFSNESRIVLPRQTRLGPIHGNGWIFLDGERVLFLGAKKEIVAIDAEAGFLPTPGP